MIQGFGWIEDLVRWCVHLLPHYDAVECTHKGVKVRNRLLRSGIKVKKLEPGGYWYWPVTTKIYTTSVARNPQDLPTQSVDTKDGHPMMFSVSLVTLVNDPVKVLTKIEDIDDIIAEFGAAAAVDCVATREIEGLREDFASGTIEEELLEATKDALRKFGVRVEVARFTDLCRHTPIRVEGGGATPFVVGDDE